MKQILIGFVLAVALAGAGVGIYVGYLGAKRAAIVYQFLSEPVMKTQDGKTVTRADVLSYLAAQAVAEKKTK